MDSQHQLALMGSVTRPKYRHSMQEIRICRNMADAVYLSMRHAQMTQEALASRIFVTPAYMSMLLAGKRPWQQALLERIRTASGSLATLQYAAMREGVELYCDPIQQREAELERELAELRMQKAA